ncbi:hypothetical protein [Rhodospirillaceae bacterium SYSU D60014]|uniref:hypothetical protein n=1 Tax=Virgifigura deserti TaxID=2268457 RepID=UPI000E66AE8E
MEAALIGFVAGVVGAAALNIVLSPLWDLSGLRNRIYVELLLCAPIRPEAYDRLDLNHNVAKLRVLAAELQSFDRSATRLTRALITRKGYDLPAAVEALIGLSNSLTEGADGVRGYLAHARNALRIPDIGFPVSGSPDDHAGYRVAKSET